MRNFSHTFCSFTMAGLAWSMHSHCLLFILSQFWHFFIFKNGHFHTSSLFFFFSQATLAHWAQTSLSFNCGVKILSADPDDMPTLWAIFLAHLSRRFRGELLVYHWLRRPSSVCQHFQTSSPLKPLGQLNSNFIFRLLRMREQNFVQIVLVTWPRWPPRPYMVKTL